MASSLTRYEFCNTVVKHETISFEWIIHDFSKLPDEKGQNLVSKRFGTYPKWRLVCYPQGRNRDSYEILFVFLALDSPSGGIVRARVRLSALDTLRNESQPFEEEFNFSKDRMEGGSMNISRSSLTEDQLLNDDKLIISCTVTLFQETDSTSGGIEGEPTGEAPK
jgi:hypothetical protein